MNTQQDETERGTIAVVLKGYPRLSETFIAQELRGLERAGFRLVLFSMRRPTDKTVHAVHREMQARVVYLPEYLHEEPLRVLRALRAVAGRPGFGRTLRGWFGDLWRDPNRNRVRRFGQACVLVAELPGEVARLYAHFIHTPAAVARYAAGLSGLTWTCSAHAKDIWTSPDWELTRNLGAADWTATCTAIGHRHLQSLSADPARVHLIYHGLDLSRFPAPPPASDASVTGADTASANAQRTGADPARPLRLLCVGRAVEKKGIDTLLEALARLPRTLHWRLDHIGGGSELGTLEALAQRLGLDDRISWRGAQDQSVVLQAYRTSELFILPCRVAGDGDRDGLPNVLVEAQSQRLACISTPISGVPELIQDGVTGLLVAPNAPQALADAIAALAADPVRRAAMAAAGEARVRSAFDCDRGLAQLIALFPPDLMQPDAGSLVRASGEEAAA